MFDKHNITSVIDLAVDLAQLLSKGVVGSLFGKKKSGEEAPSSDIKSDEKLPTDLLSEKFTRRDESHWQLLMTHLDAPVAKTVRGLEAEMDRRDDDKYGSRVDSFRIGVLIMPNKVGEEIVTDTAPKSAPEEKGKKKEKQPEEAKTITRKVDPRFTDDDARVVYLKYLAGLVEAEMKIPGGKNEADAITAVINYLEADKFLVTGESLQKAKVLAEKAADASFEEVLHFRLGKEEYDGVKNRHPLVTEIELRKLRLLSLKRREDRQAQELQTKARKRLTKCDQWIGAIPVIIVMITVIWGFVYYIFAK